MTVADVPRETLFVPEDFVQPTMPLELLQIGPNVRTEAGELEELAASIREFGVLQPVKVQSTPAGWTVLWGQRRVLAARMAGLTEIPVIVAPPADPDPTGLALEQLVENLQREDLNDLDEARALRAILDVQPDLTHEALADKLGRSRPWVSNSLRLLGLAPEVQTKLAAGEISGSHAKALVVLPPAEQERFVGRIEQGLSAHDLEREIGWKVQELKTREAAAARTEKQIPKAIAALEAAGAGKDVTIHVQHAYNLDQAPLEAAIKKAGWKLTREYAYKRGGASKCDCKVVRLEFSRVWKVELGCIEPRHRDRQRNDDQQAEQARRKVIAARVAELRALIRPLLETMPVPLLILAHGDTWALPELVENAATTDPAELRDLVADKMAGRADASQIWNDRRVAMEKALEGLIGMLEPDPVPEPTAKPAKGKKAAVARTEPAGDVVVEQNPDDPPCDWPGCTRHAFHPGRHDPRLADGGADDDLLPD